VNDSQLTVKGRGHHPVSRGNLRPRAKGQPSLNPSGRPRKVFELAQQAQQYAGVALNTLVDVMKDKKAPAAARVSAASALLDRAFGRAPQAIKLKAEATFAEQFEAFVRDLNTRRPSGEYRDSEPFE
jgi:hypothetical protein